MWVRNIFSYLLKTYKVWVFLLVWNVYHHFERKSPSFSSLSKPFSAWPKFNSPSFVWSLPSLLHWEVYSDARWFSKTKREENVCASIIYRWHRSLNSLLNKLMVAYSIYSAKPVKKNSLIFTFQINHTLNTSNDHSHNSE